jgi:hypothetical protein
VVRKRQSRVSVDKGAAKLTAGVKTTPIVAHSGALIVIWPSSFIWRQGRCVWGRPNIHDRGPQSRRPDSRAVQGLGKEHGRDAKARSRWRHGRCQQ